MAACGADDADEATPAPTTAVGPTGPTVAAATTLTETATCADFLGATGPARENATRGALIVLRGAAGVPREPAPELRARFEAAVDEACRDRRSAGMLDVMNELVAGGEETWVG